MRSGDEVVTAARVSMALSILVLKKFSSGFLAEEAMCILLSYNM